MICYTNDMMSLGAFVKERLLDKCIIESLLDDEDDILDNMDSVVYDDMIKNPNSNFRTDFGLYDHDRLKKSHFEVGNSFYKDHTLGLSSRYVDQKTNISLKTYFPNLNSLKCGVYLNSARESIITDKSLANDVTCCQFVVKYGIGLSNINIHINPKQIEKELKIFTTNITNTVVLEGYGNMTLNNVNIEWDRNTLEVNRMILFRFFHDLPELKNVTGNAYGIGFYDSSFFDYDSLDKMFPIFEWPITVRVRDHKTGNDKDIVVKNLKKAKAICNNSKRYTLITQAFKLKPNAKVTDVIDISKLKDVKYVSFRDNNVRLVFKKDAIKNAYICEPEPFKPNTFQVTKDGFSVYFEKEY